MERNCREYNKIIATLLQFIGSSLVFRTNRHERRGSQEISKQGRFPHIVRSNGADPLDGFRSGAGKHEPAKSSCEK
jgi:hypothetical protein